MRKQLLAYTFSFITVLVSAQGTYIPIGSDVNHYLERLEIKTGLVKEFHTANKPYDRKIAVDFINGLDSLVASDDFTDMDNDNINYIYKDNFEFDDIHVPKTEDPKLKFLWTHPAHFLSAKVPHFSFALNPAIQIRLGGSFKDEADGDKFKYLTDKGFELRGQVDDIFGFYALFLSEQGTFPNYVQDYTKRTGTPPGAGYWKNYKEGGYDYFLAKGYVTITPTKHFHMQFGYDNNFIGDGIRSMFLSDFGANYLFLKLNTNVWKINYQNIFAEMTKNYSQSNPDQLLTKKYMAMHHLSMNITKNVNIGVFESVIFRRENTFELQYLNPIIFYRSIEQALGSPDNAFIGFDFKVNIPRHVQIYGQLLLDEFNFSKEFGAEEGESKIHAFFHPNKWWGTKFSTQLGVKYIDAFGVDHLDFQFEANLIRPYTYSHYDTITSWTHYNQPLAHPLGGNLAELIFQAKYQPLQQLFLSSRFIYNNRGEDNDTSNWGGNPLKVYGTFEQEYGNKVGQGVNAKTFYWDLVATYEPWHNIFVDLTYVYRKKKSEDVARNMQTHFLNLSMRWCIPYRRYDF